MSSQKEVVVIRAGVIGCSIAYHLAKRGVPSQAAVELVLKLGEDRDHGQVLHTVG